MDLAALEFPAIVDRLAAATGTPRGEELALALEPSALAEDVRRRQALTAEAVALLDGSAEPAFEGIQDVRAAVELASRGGVLDPPVLRAVASTVGGGLRVRSALGEPSPLLSGAGLGDRAGARPARRGDRTDDRRGRLRRPRQRLARCSGSCAGSCANGALRVSEELQRLARSRRAARAPPGVVPRRSAAGARCSRSSRARGAGAGDRPRRLGLGPDGVRRAARGGRAGQPARRGGRGRARGGGADPARALGGRRRPGRRARRARRGVGALDLAVACGALSRALARRSRSRSRTRCACRCTASAARPRRPPSRSTSTSATCARS